MPPKATSTRSALSDSDLMLYLLRAAYQFEFVNVSDPEAAQIADFLTDMQHRVTTYAPSYLQHAARHNLNMM